MTTSPDVDNARAGSKVGLGLGYLRCAVGVTLIALPQLAVGRELDGAGRATATLLARTVGVRDVVMGLGTINAARSDDAGALRRWLGVGVASDALDVALGAASARQVGPAAAIIPVPVVVTGLWALLAGESGQWPDASGRRGQGSRA